MEAFQRLENEFADWNSLDPKGMVACSSGTAALHLAFEAMQLPLGSQVIVPDLTMVACPRAVTLAGLVPKFVNCDDRLRMCPDAIKRILPGEKQPWSPKAVLAVHIYGRICHEDVGWIAKDHDMKVIEDLAECHNGAVSRFSNAACWSFYKNKIIHGEEGGAVWFRNPDHAKLARQLRSLGFTDDHDFTHIPRGHNYRMSNCHAELILKSLAEANENIERRACVERWYDEQIEEHYQMPKRDAVWVYDLRVPRMKSAQQDRLIKNLRASGVEARHCFKPMTTQEEYRGLQPVSLNALRLSQEVIYLPVHPSMTEADVTRIVAKFSDALRCSTESL